MRRRIATLNERVIVSLPRATLNSRWDWWAIGGRWSAILKLLPGCQGFTTPIERDQEFAKILGGLPSEPLDPKLGFCDQARKCDIDWAGMRAEVRAEAAERWRRVRSWTKGQDWLSWKEVHAKYSGDAARKYYNSQPAVQAIREGRLALPPDQRRDWSYACSDTLEEYVAAAELHAVIPYAAVVRGEWHGAESDDGTDWTWNKKFLTFLIRCRKIRWSLLLTVTSNSLMRIW